MARRNREIKLPAPYLKRLWLDASRVDDRAAYPFCLPFLHDAFSLSFDRAITIIVGENGTGKSTLLEGIAALAGYNGAGGGKGYMTVDHSDALEVMGGELSRALCASWLPKITNGWFFRPRASSPSRDISTRQHATSVRANRTSSRTRTAKVSCASSRSAASARVSSSSTSRSLRCRRRARSSS
jgi:predicted ATPase